MMCELRKYFKDNRKLYSLLLSIVPLSLLNNEYFPDQKHFFGGTFKSFETANRKEKKTPKKYTDFLLDEFHFFPKPKDDTYPPRKKSLKRRISQLETSLGELEESSSQSNEQLHELEIQLNSKEENIILINESLCVKR